MDVLQILEIWWKISVTVALFATSLTSKHAIKNFWLGMSLGSSLISVAPLSIELGFL